MKKNVYISLLLILFCVGSVEVNASSGRLRKDSIKTCGGITYGQHSSDNHWHIAELKDGSYYATGNPIYSDPCSSSNSNNSDKHESDNNNNTTNNNDSNQVVDSDTTNDSNNNQSSNSNEENESNNDTTESKPNDNQIIKSNDATVKNIIIDDKKIDIKDKMEYLTNNENIKIEVIPSDEKATYEIKNNKKLEIGSNEIIIEITAEDGTKKSYVINVTREIKLSSDTNIKVIIDGEKVSFDDNKAKVYVSSSAQNISLEYTLSDERSKVDISKLDGLKTGDNILTLKVTAEDGTESVYEITIYKYSQFEEIISTILAFAMLGGIGYGIYILIKKIKSKKNK